MKKRRMFQIELWDDVIRISDKDNALLIKKALQKEGLRVPKIRKVI